MRPAASSASDTTRLPSGPWLRRGFIVRWPHRLLWPHPSFCRPPLVYFVMPAVPRPTEVPNLLRQGLIPCRRPYSGGSHAPMTSRSLDLAVTLSEEARQPLCSTHRTKCGPIHEAAAFTLCCGPESCLPRFRTGLLRPSLRERGRPSPHVGYYYMVSSSFTITGLSPVGLAALWAANGLHGLT